MDKPDVGPVSYRFVERLSNLTPTRRRLALAAACRHAWRENPERLPDCYRWDYEYALSQEQEQIARLQTQQSDLRRPPPFDPESLYSSDRPPISLEFLDQLKEMTPVARATFVLLGANSSWFRDDVPELERESPPAWLQREIDYMNKLSRLEDRALELARRRVGIRDLM